MRVTLVKLILINIIFALNAKVNYQVSCPQYDCQVKIYHDQDFMGSANFILLPHTSNYYLHSLYVKKEYRNNSVGSSLVKYILNQVRQSQAKKVYLRVGPFERKYEKNSEDYESVSLKPFPTLYQQKKISLRKFYENLGFVEPSFFDMVGIEVYLKLSGLKADRNDFMVFHFD